MEKADLENRLIEFSSQIHLICINNDKSDLGKHLSQQLIRSGTSPALNYGEAKVLNHKKTSFTSFE